LPTILLFFTTQILPYISTFTALSDKAFVRLTDGTVSGKDTSPQESLVGLKQGFTGHSAKALTPEADRLRGNFFNYLNWLWLLLAIRFSRREGKNYFCVLGRPWPDCKKIRRRIPGHKKMPEANAAPGARVLYSVKDRVI